MENAGSLFLALNSNHKGLPLSIEIIPAGSEIQGRDGRKGKNLNPQKVAANSMARLQKLVIDENHATDLSAPKGGSSPAMGWMSGLRAGEGGSIWADVEWTKRGSEAVLNKEYSFISPVFLHNDQGEITVVLRAALTNSPNLQLPAINSAQTPDLGPEKNNKEENPMDLKVLCATLGISETATEAEALAAIKALNAAKAEKPQPQTDTSKVDLAAYAPRADLNAMEARALAAEKQVADLNSARLKKEAEAAVDEAIRNRKFAPASRDVYMALCSTQEGFEKFKNICAATPPIIGTETQAPEGAPPAAGNDPALNAEEQSVAKAMGYTEEEFKKLKGGGQK